MWAAIGLHKLHKLYVLISNLRTKPRTQHQENVLIRSTGKPGPHTGTEISTGLAYTQRLPTHTYYTQCCSAHARLQRHTHTHIPISSPHNRISFHSLNYLAPLQNPFSSWIPALWSHPLQLHFLPETIHTFYFIFRVRSEARPTASIHFVNDSTHCSCKGCMKKVCVHACLCVNVFKVSFNILPVHQVISLQKTASTNQPAFI